MVVARGRKRYSRIRARHRALVKVGRKLRASRRRTYRKISFRARSVPARGARRHRRRVSRMTSHILPLRKFFKARYRACNTVEFTATTPGPLCAACGSANTIRMNSIYDPSSATTGTFNEVASYHNFFGVYYQQYKVVGTTISYTLRPHPESAGDWENIPIKWGVFFDFDGSPTGLTSKTWQEMAACPDGKWTSFTWHGQGDYKQKSKITMHFDPKVHFTAVDPMNQRAQFGANPSTLLYTVPWIAAPNTDYDLNQYKFHVEIRVTYKVVAFDMKDWGQILDNIAQQ